MEDVLAKALAQIKWEEDEANFIGKANSTYYGSRHNERVERRDHSHRTGDCIALKYEVAELLKQGHLREFLTDKEKQTYARRDDQRQTNVVDSPPEPPRQDRVINYVAGGSEISGISYSAAKRHTQQVSNAEIHPRREHPSKIDETVTALREMQVDESKLSRRTTMLAGFSGKQKSTLGEIVLPVYAEGVNLYINFLVLDC
ncbi:hypothetical protein Q3G72_019293 [Acer saccharum]|nr:hypothetical protein Q3G72_019293 [Acer saccharum]